MGTNRGRVRINVLIFFFDDNCTKGEPHVTNGETIPCHSKRILITAVGACFFRLHSFT